MKLLIISLSISYASAGTITGFTTRHKLGTRHAPTETEDVHSLSGGGKVFVYLVPYVKSGKTTDVVEVLWQNPQGSKYTLDFLTVNWPSTPHKLSAVKSFIQPQSIDKKLTIKIKYVKLSGSSTRTYTYNKKKDLYSAS